ncbi:protein O-mannosyl-transferase family [Ancylomarina sp.]|uniref:protein O-mannosyl-transferase family n=1 Tax=Ancylomarina sp. TaxID=1970196 RepID=UPI00356A6F49
MSKFQKFNIIGGWLVFSISALVYLLTLEPSVSFWDCGEFITAAYKLEIGHPPGAPIFMLLGRFFSLFASDESQVALMLNSLSAIASAFTIMFLFWSITYLARKLIKPENGDYNSIQTGKILSAGLIGALAYAFSDTFWFSAVEAEVYALSSLFTAVVFWAILKWESEADSPHANRWLILIAYLMGLSIGVHLLNLLAIPAIVILFYFKKYPVTKKGILIALSAAILLLASIMYLIIPGVLKVGIWFEFAFVNGLSLPFNSGLLFYLVLLFIGLIISIRYSIKRQKVLLNTLLTVISVILIGYSSYSLIMIRASANPALNQNNPKDVFSLLSYLNREQYGSNPLIYGQYFNAPTDEENPSSVSKKVYIQKNGKYELSYELEKNNYSSSHKTLFPRMYTKGMSGRAPVEYAKWTGLNPKQKEKPSFGQNLNFFFSYQINHMYIRYFMWNFAGRQNDVQSYGDKTKGAWISGIPFIDNLRLGDQSLRSDDMKSNKANNTYYFLPLILGLIGLVYQYKHSKKGKNDFYVVLLLFLFTGLAIVLYLNQPPLQPRERDYAYAGSFYAFAIWIGLGVLAVINGLEKYLTPKLSLILASSICFLAVPALLAQQNWDDHDRSDRYFAHDLAYNYLNSCAPNAILFTMGDNDTFPLWYLQEVEGIRTDVRVCNLSYLSTDWYIDQMKRDNYDSKSLPISMDREKYLMGNRDVVYIVDDPRFEAWVKKNKGLNLKDALEYVLSDKESTKTIYGYDQKIDHIPAREFRLPIDKQQILATQTVSAKDSTNIVSQLEWKLNQNFMEKSGLALYDMLLTNNWKRPIYFSQTVPKSGYYGLQDYFQLEGLAYRLVPIKTADTASNLGRIDSDILFENMMNKFKWGNINKKGIYRDENIKRMCLNLRNNFLSLSNTLISENQNEKAIEVLDRSRKLLPNEVSSYDYIALLMAENYLKLGKRDTAMEMMNIIQTRLTQELNYYNSLKPTSLSDFVRSGRRNEALLGEMKRIIGLYKKKELTKSE